MLIRVIYRKLLLLLIIFLFDIVYLLILDSLSFVREQIKLFLSCSTVLFIYIYICIGWYIVSYILCSIKYVLLLLIFHHTAYRQ